MALLIVLPSIVLLILLISWCRLNAFLAFLLVSILAGLLLGIPLSRIVGSVGHGVGDTLGSLTLLYGLVGLAIPAIVIAGPLFSMTLKKIPLSPSALSRGWIRRRGCCPGVSIALPALLLPVFLLVITGLLQYFCSGNHPQLWSVAGFAGDLAIVMLVVSLLIAAYTPVPLIIAGAGALKQVLSDSGVS